MALEGIRVVELADFLAGPVQGVILGDYGAEVIKIERPVVGAAARDPDGVKGIVPDADINYCWENQNRNKKSLCLNLKTKEGQEVAYRLIKTADVFLSNVEIVELEKFNMTYEVLSKINPRLIYAHSSLYGHVGPDAGKRGFDMGAWARSGIMHRIGDPGAAPPMNPVGLPDCTNGTFSVLGIMLALFVRERTGSGQMITNSIFGSLLWTCMMPFDGAAVANKEEQPVSREDQGNPFYNRYKTKDGRWLVLLRSNWHDACEAIGMQQYERDPRFDTYGKRLQNHTELVAILDKAVAAKTAQEWTQAFQGKDILWSLAQTFLEAVNDPQTESNHYIETFDHPKFGTLKYSGIPFRLSKTPPTIRTAAPDLAQHNDEILISLGYSTKEISQFKESGTVWPK